MYTLIDVIMLRSIPNPNLNPNNQPELNCNKSGAEGYKGVCACEGITVVVLDSSLSRIG